MIINDEFSMIITPRVITTILIINVDVDNKMTYYN